MTLAGLTSQAKLFNPGVTCRALDSARRRAYWPRCQRTAVMSVVETVAREAGQDFIRDIVRADLTSGRRKTIVTRFPPKPNGYLHIGHAKSIKCINLQTSPLHDDRRADLGAIVQVDNVIVGHANAA
jgi:hypothetical protein